MKTLIPITLAAAAIVLPGCEQAELPVATANRFEATDALVATIRSNATALDAVVEIDHSRLAQKEEVIMPPSVVSIFRKPAVDAALMALNPRVGLDLPHKVLVYEERGQPTVAFPNSAFLAKRHGLADSPVLREYDAVMRAGLAGIPEDLLAPVDGTGVVKDYGITELVSEFPHGESIDRLKTAVMAQGDTVWFGEVDLKAEAAASGKELPAATLLLFGGPKPGGVAMAKFPKLGLDAFCQKLLVYEDDGGLVKVIFNDISAMAELHYGTSAEPHKVINGRLAKTFEGAVTKKAQ